MDEQPQPTTDKPSLRARIGAAWQALRTNAADWWTETGRDAAAVSATIVLFFICVAVAGLAIDWKAEQRQARAVVATPGLQDQIDALRLRVIVLEARADALPKPAAAPRASVPRAGASTPTAPDPDQFADSSELVEPPTPPAPITRQSVDQFRASLRTPQPVQE